MGTRTQVTKHVSWNDELLIVTEPLVSEELLCDIFTCALVSSVTVPALHLRTLPQGTWVSSKTVSSHLSSHRVAPIAHCALNPLW